jgi:hypothetical protein
MSLVCWPFLFISTVSSDLISGHYHIAFIVSSYWKNISIAYLFTTLSTNTQQNF